MTLGSACVSLVGFGVSPKHSFQKVRDREEAIANRETRAPRGGESELRRVFQQLDDAFQQPAAAAAIETAMIETQGYLRLSCRNEV
jgi:hypothetical protein